MPDPQEAGGRAACRGQESAPSRDRTLRPVRLRLVPRRLPTRRVPTRRDRRRGRPPGLAPGARRRVRRRCSSREAQAWPVGGDAAVEGDGPGAWGVSRRRPAPRSRGGRPPLPAPVRSPFPAPVRSPFPAPVRSPFPAPPGRSPPCLLGAPPGRSPPCRVVRRRVRPAPALPAPRLALSRRQQHPSGCLTGRRWWERCRSGWPPRRAGRAARGRSGGRSAAPGEGVPNGPDRRRAGRTPDPDRQQRSPRHPPPSPEPSYRPRRSQRPRSGDRPAARRLRRGRDRPSGRHRRKMLSDLRVRPHSPG